MIRDKTVQNESNSINQYFMENELKIDNSLCDNDVNTFMIRDTKSLTVIKTDTNTNTDFTN